MAVSRVVLLLFLVTVIASSLLASVVNASDPHNAAAAQCSDAHQDGNHRCLFVDEDDDSDSEDEGHGDDDDDHEEVEDDDFDDTYKIVNNVKVSAPIHDHMDSSVFVIVKGH